MARGDIYTPVRNMIIQVGGAPVNLRSGMTLIREGHDIMKGREDMFRKVDVTYEVSNRPGRPKGSNVIEVGE